ncbi:MAG: addiction module protein [Ignavibacteriae bacterium]|nr:addiction module protein [Ignavibacteriota bacterium]
MSAISQQLLTQALSLPPTERAELADRLLTSLEIPSSQSIDELWAKEVEERIDAYERGEISTVPVHEVFEKLRKKQIQ